MIRNLSIYLKVTLGIILFTLTIGGIERYQISQNIINQFFEAKKSKNLLLINTIAPILGLNITLGLDDANIEYLEYIAEQNPDVTYIELTDSDGKVTYQSKKYFEKLDQYQKQKVNIDFCYKEIFDSVTQKVVGNLHLHFSNNDFQQLQSNNRFLTLKLMLVTFILLTIFVLMIRREFQPLKELSNSVLSYDPKLNNFFLTTSHRHDEVGVIQNAIVSMVDRIRTYTQLLDETNISLEDKIKERTKALEEANIQLRALSVTDELTQLSNRRYFEEYYQQNWELAKRHKKNISLVMCDIDYFKRVNDTYGHQIGDEVLKLVAFSLKESLKRNSDFVARYGGEEFIIVMYETTLDDAERVCKRVQENLEKNQHSVFKENEIDAVTMSFGISSIVPTNNDDSESLIKKADHALYEAKESGRNCIHILL